MSHDIIIQYAKITDLPAIQALLRLVNLPTQDIQAHLTNYLVLLKSDKVFGTIGLEIYGSVALLRSLAVHPSLRGQGYGLKLFNMMHIEVRKKKIQELFLLTETAELFFSRLGFRKVSRDSVPIPIQHSSEFAFICPQSAICMHLRLL